MLIKIKNSIFAIQEQELTLLKITFMKKIITLSAAALLLGGLLFTSCSSRTLCPAYPPPTYQGDVENADDISNDDIIIEEQKNL